MCVVIYVKQVIKITHTRTFSNKYKSLVLILFQSLSSNSRGLRKLSIIREQLEAMDRGLQDRRQGRGRMGQARGAAPGEEACPRGQLNLLDARNDELNDAQGGIKRMEYLRKDDFEAFQNPMNAC